MDKIDAQARILAMNGYILNSAQRVYLEKYDDLLTETEQSFQKRSASHRFRRKTVRNFIKNQAKQHIELAFLCIISLTVSALADKHSQLESELPAWWDAQSKPAKLGELARATLRKYVDDPLPNNPSSISELDRLGGGPPDSLSTPAHKRPLPESEAPETRAKRLCGATFQDSTQAVEIGHSLSTTIFPIDSSDVRDSDATGSILDQYIEEVDEVADSSDGEDGENSDGEDGENSDGYEKGDNVAVGDLWDRGQIPVTSEANVYILSGMDAVQVIALQKEPVVRLTIPNSGSVQPFMLVSCAWGRARKFIGHRDRLA